MHFYLSLNLNVGNVCMEPPYNENNPPSVFFFLNLLKSLHLSQIEPSLRVMSHGRRPLPR